MRIANRPITEFYRRCLSAARNKGYKWVITLLARKADVDGLYSNLCRDWSSLDSITGKYFLFIFAGKENRTPENSCESIIFDERESWMGEYNDFVSLN